MIQRMMMMPMMMMMMMIIMMMMMMMKMFRWRMLLLRPAHSFPLLLTLSARPWLRSLSSWWW